MLIVMRNKMRVNHSKGDTDRNKMQKKLNPSTQSNFV